jgi:Outer membrane protein beta-barrel domain
MHSGGPQLKSLYVAGAIFCLSVSSGAQEVKPIEISPFAGYFLGGKIFDSRMLGPYLSFANDLTYGVRVGWNATPHIEPEFQWSRTETEFSPAHPEYLHSLNVDYFLGGASYNFGSAATRPYFSLDFGAARINAIDYVPDTLFTISVGAGVKHFFTPNFGLRIDARGYTSKTDEHLKSVCTTSTLPDGVGGPSVPVPCAHDWLLNGDVTGGVVIAF